jgi:dipeptidyl-peptidase 4
MAPYVFPRGGEPRAVSPPGWDIESIDAVTPDSRWIYSIASPENFTGRYLFRARLDQIAPPERMTPATEAGVHRYSVSPDGHWAFHFYSRFDTPGVVERIRLPEHEVVRTFVDNAELRKKVEGLGGAVGFPVRPA